MAFPPASDLDTDITDETETDNADAGKDHATVHNALAQMLNDLRALLTTDGDLITRSGGVWSRLTRAGLAGDSAFTSAFDSAGAASAVDADLDAHIADSSAAHAASAISIADAGNDFTATDVEGALAELQADHEADATALTDHTGDTSGAHAASAISYSGGTGMSATDVEAAIDELATEKANDADVVHDTGDETIAGTKTFSTAPVVPSVAYNATTWNGANTPATRDDIRDLWESNPEIFAADPTELDVAADGEVTILSPIARQADVDTEVDRLDTYLPVYVEKPTSNQTISSTSAADITGMTLALTVGTWQLDGVIYYEGTAGAGSNLAITWTVPSSATGSWTGQGPAIATAASGHIAATVISRRRDFTQEEIVGATGSGQICAVHLFGKIIVPNAGDLLPRARLDSGSDNITIHAATSSGIGSWLVGHRVA